ncbi:hypothetical protein [Mucilaginibacter sp. dw_454]|uniref:hypothetical protein n=1 Tax=Mucilaginibacter sp. dw_454 TaxID=2720079 RepID=UPI001BD34B63|nr:hypothetical protein [Mucilaginibacter sp. dw_454]
MMNQKLSRVIIVCLLFSATAFAQSKKKTTKTEYLGTWKLVSSKVTYPDGQIFVGDSSNILQRKIITPNNFVIIIERKIPSLDNKRRATSVAGGHYTLVNGNYEEVTEYASWKGFENVKINGQIMMEHGKLHAVANLTGLNGPGVSIYDEWYVRED